MAFRFLAPLVPTPKSRSHAPRYVPPDRRSTTSDQDLSDSRIRSNSNSSHSSSSSKPGNWRTREPLPARNVFTKAGHILFLPELHYIKPESCIHKQFHESDYEGACNHPIVPLRTFTGLNGEEFLEFMPCTSFGGRRPIDSTSDWMKRGARLVEHAGAVAHDWQAPLQLETGSSTFEKPTYILTGKTYHIDQVLPYKPSVRPITLSTLSVSRLQQLAR
jgi:hypothetical protein